MVCKKQKEMNSRESILQKIRQNKPSFQALPEAISFVSEFDNLTHKFGSVLESIGGYVKVLPDYQAVLLDIKATFSDKTQIMTALPELAELSDFDFDGNDVHQLETVNLAILKGSLGVAENGAIWLSENQMLYRVLPFITQHLILIIEEKSLVSNMHEAYKKINIMQEGFGAFIAGPSKTADIEQSLVIGAHGARSLQVYILK
jgi:L-lactate dehydrogenase complex protein LldG